MTALFVTVLLASLAGSLHCAGMCGAFAAFAIGVGDPAVRQSKHVLLALYQGGRLVTYMVLGAIAGMLGAGVDFGARAAGFQHAAAVLSGVLMVGFGSVTLARLAGWKVPAMPIPAGWSATVSRAHRQALSYSPPVRAVATGLLTTLIPCGWLYAFVITAGGTGHALTGALLMAAFWIGTLPALTVVALGTRALAGAFANRVPYVAATAVLVVGLYTIASRGFISLHNTSHDTDHSPAALLYQVKSIDTKTLPCCTPAEKGGVQ